MRPCIARKDIRISLRETCERLRVWKKICGVAVVWFFLYWHGMSSALVILAFLYSRLLLSSGDLLFECVWIPVPVLSLSKHSRE